MGVERRGTRLYEYRRVRVGGEVRTEYLGARDPAMAALIRAEAEAEAERRALDRRQTKEAEARAAAVLDAAGDFDRLADQVFRSTMYLSGFHLHHRSEWRRLKGVNPMAKSRKTTRESDEPDDWDLDDSELDDDPAPAIVTPCIPHLPEVQMVLDKAAKGDRSVLPKLQTWLKTDGFRDGLGSIAGFAEQMLVRMAAGDNIAVAEAVSMKLADHFQELLSDAPQPTFAERLAARRVVHDWIATHILETMLADPCRGTPPGSNAAAAIDKQLSRAERRLFAALKSLATLRRLRVPNVSIQANVAGGDLRVNNNAKVRKRKKPRPQLGAGG